MKIASSKLCLEYKQCEFTDVKNRTVVTRLTVLGIGRGNNVCQDIYLFFEIRCYIALTGTELANIGKDYPRLSNSPGSNSLIVEL